VNLYLTGYRCTGKTTVGRLVAGELDRRLVDADDYLVQKAGRSIKEIFAQEGEVFFRDLESECLAEFAAQDGLVVATGGGVILRPENVERMKASGCVVLLEADARTIHRRMQADRRTSGLRPSLTGLPPLAEIMEMLAYRGPLYRAAAEARFDSVRNTPEQLARLIVDHFRGKEAVK
jgi:shikimate kinase